MQEKIKIYIPDTVYETLYRDIVLFEILKKDNTPNVSGFLNLLLCNYFSKYNENNIIISKSIEDILMDEISIDKNKIKSVVENILYKSLKIEYKKLSNNTEHTISFKPNNIESESIIDYIKTNGLRYQSLSEYLRNMLLSYVRCTMDQRESIIFADSIKKINLAINNRNKLFIVLKNNNKLLISPYKITKSKNELFNYLICGDNNSNLLSIRISRIKSIQTDSSKFIIDDNFNCYIEKACKYGPPFLITQLGNEIKVRLTENGELLFNRLYVYRPTPIKIDKSNKLYSFDCSTEQVKQYFSRFGNDAKIISPESLKEEMKEYFKKCYNGYLN